MPDSRFSQAAQKLLRPKEFQEIRHAFWMVLWAFAPITVVFCTFQFGVTGRTVDLMCATSRSKIAGHDLTPLFVYYIAWAAHMFVSGSVIFLGARSAYRNIPSDKAAAMRRFAILATLMTMFFLLLVDALHCKLAVLTHERIFSVLSREHSLCPFFEYEAEPHNHPISFPTIFSLFPIISVGAAFWATATIVLCASRSLGDFHEINNILDAKVTARMTAFSETLEALRSQVLALSLVLVTSTLGTVAYLRTPLGLLADADRHSFKTVSDAIGLMWGVTFSLTLLALCFYPFIRLRVHLKAFDQEAVLTHSEALRQWLKENRALMQVPANLQLVLSVLLPATVAVVTNLVST